MHIRQTQRLKEQRESHFSDPSSSFTINHGPSTISIESFTNSFCRGQDSASHLHPAMDSFSGTVFRPQGDVSKPSSTNGEDTEDDSGECIPRPFG